LTRLIGTEPQSHELETKLTTPVAVDGLTAALNVRTEATGTLVLEVEMVVIVGTVLFCPPPPPPPILSLDPPPQPMANPIRQIAPNPSPVRKWRLVRGKLSKSNEASPASKLTTHRPLRTSGGPVSRGRFGIAHAVSLFEGPVIASDTVALAGAPLVKVTDEGAIVQVEPGMPGDTPTSHASITVLVEFVAGMTVREKVPVCPAVTTSDEGAAEIEKSGAVTVM
jgi:hypothetical protein